MPSEKALGEAGRRTARRRRRHIWLPLAFVAIWFGYRIARGWLRLGARQPMYA